MTATQLFTREGEPFKGRATTNDAGRMGFYPGWRVCGRCGGQGGAQKWQFTGYTCFECGGENRVNGLTTVPSERFVPLYTADRLAKLNAAKAKADATREAKREAAAAAEAARVAAEREGIIAAHKDILARIAPWAEVSSFLADMATQVTEKARPLSERQLEAAVTACAKFEAEKARREAAAHVGTVGERLELDLTFVRMVDLTRDRFDPVFRIWTFRTAEGCTVVFKGGEPKAFNSLWERVQPEGEKAYYRTVPGRTIRLKATIKAHDANRNTGEPETIIQRPAVVA